MKYPPRHLFIGHWGVTRILFAECLVCDRTVNMQGRAPTHWLRAFAKFLRRHRHCGFRA